MDLEVTGSGIRAVGDEATSVGGRLRAADVTSPLESAAIAVPGSETARALGQLALQLRDEVTRVAGGWEAWGRAAEASANAYETSDAGAARDLEPRVR